MPFQVHVSNSNDYIQSHDIALCHGYIFLLQFIYFSLFTVSYVSHGKHICGL